MKTFLTISKITLKNNWWVILVAGTIGLIFDAGLFWLFDTALNLGAIIGCYSGAFLYNWWLDYKEFKKGDA
jgi:hypothetical protein